MTEEKRNLVLITGEYPFGHTETFLETEIKFLAKGFKKIIILPTTTSSKARTLPENVEVNINYALRFKNKYRKLRSIFTSMFFRGLIMHWRYLYSLSAIRWINSFVSDAIITFSFLEENTYDEHLIYTYWFNGKTYGAENYAIENERAIVVSRGHRYDVYDYWFTPSFWPFRAESLKRIDKLFLISEDANNYMTQLYGCEHKMIVSRLGVNDPGFIVERSMDQVMSLVTVSGLIPVKRINVLANYLIKFCEDHPEFQISWTHMGDGPMKADILQVLNQNILRNFRYNFLGQVSNASVIEFYKRNPVDLFLNVSESEGIPVSIMEAQSVAVACAATDVGGVSEIINNKNGVLLSPAFEYDEFSQLLEDFFNKDYDFKPQVIKTEWNLKYNAGLNYGTFIKQLTNLKI